MSYRPIVYCRECNEPMDVWTELQERICDECRQRRWEKEQQLRDEIANSGDC
jgi:hypothetical protein